MKYTEEKQAFCGSEHPQCVGSSATAPFTRLSTGKCRTLTLLVLLLLCALVPLAAQTRAELQDQARDGDAEAQYKLGYCYYWGQLKYNGKFDDKLCDVDMAIYWFEKAAAQGYGEAYFNLGLAYQNRKKDKDEAVYWFKKYADYKYDVTGKIDKTAIQSLKELGVDYDPGAQRSSGNMAQTRAELQELAEAGDAEAQYKLGECYYKGKLKYKGPEDEVPRDVDMAIYWFRKAAEQGYGDAYFDLGLAYQYRKKDKDEAVYWLKKSADYEYDECGNINSTVIESLKALGVDYDPVTKSSSNVAATRAELYRLAEAGDAEAQYKLGYCYYWGKLNYNGSDDEVSRDVDKAVYWLRKAAEQGYGDAYLDLGRAYKLSDEDKDEAIYWYKKYADYWYDKNGYESRTATDNLKALGVEYDPSARSSSGYTADTAGNSSAQSSEGASSSSSTGKLLAYGTYTISSEANSYSTFSSTDDPGPDETVYVEFYDDHIEIDGDSYEYTETFNGKKVYKGVVESFYVDENYDIDYYVFLGFDMLRYTVSKKGEIVIL